MSSTNRQDRPNSSDYYVTPQKPIIEFLKEFRKYEEYAFDGLILDPCAGGDSKNPMAYPTALETIGIPKYNIDTIDIREDSLAKKKHNYLSTPIEYRYRTIITNPPFNISLEIIKKALKDTDKFVIMLLRLNYFGTKKRRPFWKSHMAKYCFVHSERIGFTGNSKRDSIEYAHFVWQKHHNPTFCLTKVI